MATSAEIQQVRAATNELANVPPFTDDFITTLIDAVGVTETEYKIWTAKRNMAADLVQISEGGSTRANQQVFDHYSKIVAGYETDPGNAGNARRAPRTREIEI